MALKINFSQSSIPAYIAACLNLDTATLIGFYIRIDLQTCDKSSNLLQVNWYSLTTPKNEVFDDNESEDHNEILPPGHPGTIIPFFSRNYCAPIVIDSEDNYIKQGYEFLKTLPEFEGAIDC